MKRLFIVTGASGKLGEAFIKKLKEKSEVVYSFSRKFINLSVDKSFTVDLLKEDEVEINIKQIEFQNFDKVVLIHTVGKFKFQESDEQLISLNNDGIDYEIYNTNVVTTQNIIKFITSNLPSKTELLVCVFASVSDKYNIPFWSSYTKSKNILREYLRVLCEENKISAIVVNVSTVDTGNENLLRPNADKTYWLKPVEVVDQLISKIDSANKYTEIDVIKNKQDFDKGYYLDHEAILNKWRKEMGLDN